MNPIKGPTFPGSLAARFVLYLVVAVAWLWPLPAHLATDMPDTMYWWDGLFALWAGDTARGNLFTLGAHRFDSLAYYPEKTSLAFSEHLVLIGLVAAPIEWLWTHAAAYNIVLILALATSGLALDQLARRMGALPSVALACGMIFAFTPVHLFHLARMQLLWVFCFPLAWLAAIDWLESPSRRAAFWLGAALCLPGWYNLYYVVMTGVTTALFIVAWSAVDGRARLSTRHLRSLPFGLIPLALMVAYDAPYMTGVNEPRTWQSVADWSGKTRDLLRADPLSWAWGKRLPDSVRFDGSSSWLGAGAWVIGLLGFLAPDLVRRFRWSLPIILLRVLLAGAGVAAAIAVDQWYPLAIVWVAGALAVAALRRKLHRPAPSALWYAAMTTAAGCLLLFHGPRIAWEKEWSVGFFGPWKTLMALPGIATARALRRFSIPLVASLLVLGAPAVSIWLRRLPRAGRGVIVALAFVLIFLDLRTLPIPVRKTPEPCGEPLWRALAAEPNKSPVFVFPLGSDQDGTFEEYAALCHGHPIRNGHTSNPPKSQEEFLGYAYLAYRTDICKKFGDRLVELGFRYIAIDGRAYNEAPPWAPLCARLLGAVPIFRDDCSALLSFASEDAARAIPLNDFSVDHRRCQRGTKGNSESTTGPAASR